MTDSSIRLHWFLKECSSCGVTVKKTSSQNGILSQSPPHRVNGPLLTSTRKQEVFAYTREVTLRKCMRFNCITLILNVSMKSLPRSCIDNRNPLTVATRATVINVRFSNAMNRHIRSKNKITSTPFSFLHSKFFSVNQTKTIIALF